MSFWMTSGSHRVRGKSRYGGGRAQTFSNETRPTFQQAHPKFSPEAVRNPAPSSFTPAPSGKRGNPFQSFQHGSCPPPPSADLSALSGGRFASRKRVAREVVGQPLGQQPMQQQFGQQQQQQQQHPVVDGDEHEESFGMCSPAMKANAHGKLLSDLFDDDEEELEKVEGVGKKEGFEELGDEEKWKLILGEAKIEEKEEEEKKITDID
ncbi:hypothetical protein TrLO_g13458 [Triparma laevis f. longispina]|uniref:Uncharacterized protein n=1 Tax=Triparma laevis f. longispina TaxID=1714387 RepID=A0A9W7FV04_9STRA|nr:hypothetical protein TrLO_g13458 [Triparma laevis f. longispina]